MSRYSANLRTIMTFDENEKSYFIIDTGQSESIFSSNYDDQMRLFAKGEQIEMKHGL